MEAASAVSIPRGVLANLLIAADLVREHHKAMIEATPGIIGLDTLLILDEAGLIDPDTLDVTEAFDASIAHAGALLNGSPISDVPDDEHDISELPESACGDPADWAWAEPDTAAPMPAAGSFGD